MENIPPIGFLKIDIAIQKVLGILILLTLIVFPIAMLLAIPFGAWQVISGIIGVSYGSKWRKKYLFIVASYFLFWYGTAYLGGIDIYPISAGIATIILFVVPIVLGIRYLAKTEKEIAKIEKKEGQIFEDMPDILDVELINGKY